jgi:TIR domain
MHGFISFAAEDSEYARAFAEELSERGVPTWIAPERLKPGTGDWEGAIRDAIRDSFRDRTHRIGCLRNLQVCSRRAWVGRSEVCSNRSGVDRW